MKCCTNCKELKSLDLFYKNKRFKDGLHCWCKFCHKQYKIKNHSSISRWRKENYHKNKLKFKLKNKINYLKHRSKRLIFMRKYYISNKQSLNLKNKIYRTENKQYILLKNRKRRLLLKGCNIKQKDIDNLLIEHNFECYYCKDKVIKGINLHLDHRTPLSKGGSHTINNIVPSCQKCNLQKGSKPFKDFKRELNVN